MENTPRMIWLAAAQCSTSRNPTTRQTRSLAPQLAESSKSFVTSNRFGYGKGESRGVLLSIDVGCLFAAGSGRGGQNGKKHGEKGGRRGRERDRLQKEQHKIMLVDLKKAQVIVLLAIAGNSSYYSGVSNRTSHRSL